MEVIFLFCKNCSNSPLNSVNINRRCALPARQLLVLQTEVCLKNPLHGIPPGSGSRRIVLFRVDKPPPQVVLHSLQVDHSLRKQPAGEREREREHRWMTEKHHQLKVLNTLHMLHGHDGISQLSVCSVLVQEGPPSLALQRRVLDLVPFPHETEQELQGHQGSYTGQGTLVHASVPFSHTLQTVRQFYESTQNPIKMKSNDLKM